MSSIIPVFVPHLGCPCKCVFCNQRSIASKTAPINGEEVAKIIDNALLKIDDKPEIAFYGGSFTAINSKIRTELLKTAHKYIESGKVSSIRLSTRPDAINEEILSELKKYGVKTIEIGAQSLCDDVLSKAKRGHTAEDIEKSSKLVKKFGFKLILQIMAGLPCDNMEKCLYSAGKVAEIKPDGVRIYPVVVIPDTELFEMYKSGEYKPLSVEEAAKICAVMLEVFINASIPVIRLGLNPTEELFNTVVAGAYHPAMGEICYGEMFYNKAKEKLLKIHGEEIAIIVNKSDVSKMIGQKRRNVLRLEREFSAMNIKIIEGETPKNNIIVKVVG